MYPSIHLKIIMYPISGKELWPCPLQHEVNNLKRFIISTPTAKDLLVARNFRKLVFVSS